MDLKIASWNVNSLNVRLPHVLAWCDAAAPDILALQETKLTDDRFPAEPLREAGYHSVFSGQKTYNGVAILSREAARDVVTDIPALDIRRMARELAAAAPAAAPAAVWLAPAAGGAPPPPPCAPCCNKAIRKSAATSSSLRPARIASALRMLCIARCAMPTANWSCAPAVTVH